ncbi:MAG: FtsX-like permease family protein [Xanthobacteraceae bacterium]
MNPIPMVRADLLALRWAAWAVILLVALAVAIGVAIGAQERALRQGSAQAAADFDLLIGAPGSQTQLVLTSVYLRPDALPLMDGGILDTLATDPRVRAAAPIAFGDIFRGYPVVGTSVDFASRWGRLTPTEGRLFHAEGEAVLGADVKLPLGATITPSHQVAGPPAPLGEETDAEQQHRHENVTYTAVGRLPRLGTPWDRAILIPVESVWETHGLGNGHAADAAPLGPPYDATHVPGVPAIVVKPRSIADAYALRGQYRQGGTMALFPAEVLVSLYQTMGDIRDILVAASVLNNLLIFSAVLLLLLALAGLRRRRYAILRALGAPRAYVLLVVWLGAAVLITIGCLFGLAGGWLLTAALSSILETRTGLHLAFVFDRSDLVLIAGLIGAGSALALLPALLTYRTPVAEGLRG